MKTKTFYSTLILLPLFCMAACADKDILNLHGEESFVEQSGYEQSLVDSIEMKYKMQTDLELILTDRIICKNSVFVLDLSEEEAETLQIPAEMYRRCLQHVEELNSKPEE